MDTETCTGKQGPFKCGGMMLQYDSGPGIIKQAFCTRCCSEWIISVYGDGCAKFEKRSPCPISMPKTLLPVKDRNELQKGDHITWDQGSTIHHGIVGKLVDTNEVRVFYINPNGKKEITKTTLDLTNIALYLVDYSACEVSGNDTVEQIILRARSHSKRTGTFASSQQFAVFCKTGYIPKFQIVQYLRDVYGDVVVVYPTMFSLDFLTNVAILIFNILLSIFIETVVECENCSRRQETTCSIRRYWFLSEIFLVVLEGLVCLFYVIHELYVNRENSAEEREYHTLRTNHWRVIPYCTEYLFGVALASLSVSCNLRRTFCVMWCKVCIGTIFGVIGKIGGHILGNIIQKRLRDRHRRRYLEVNQ